MTIALSSAGGRRQVGFRSSSGHRGWETIPPRSSGCQRLSAVDGPRGVRNPKDLSCVESTTRSNFLQPHLGGRGMRRLPFGRGKCVVGGTAALLVLTVALVLSSCSPTH